LNVYELFIANKNYSSWSLRPWVLMKTRGIAFVERVMPFGPGSNFEAFRAFSPTGKVPCLRDGDLVVWDSLGIAGYLAERHPELWPADLSARTWARCATAEMHSGFATLRNHCGMSLGVRVRLREWPEALQADVGRVGELWNEGLARFGGPFLAGPDFSIVDAFFCPVAYRVRTYDIPLDGSAMAYAQRLLQLPAMREWEAAGLAEPWRDEAHEEEIRQYGDVIADLRAPVEG
jgi:glutathione S-transferase